MPKRLNVTTEMTPQELHDYRMRHTELKHSTMKDKIKAWYVAETPFTLTERENEIRLRWEFARDQFMANKTYSEITQALSDEFGISIQSAKLDVRDMRVAFPPAESTDKHMHRLRAERMVLKAYAKAEEKDDVKGMMACMKQYVIIMGLDKEDPNAIDIQKAMADRTYVEALDPVLRTMLLGLIEGAGGSLDTAQIFEGIFAAKKAEDADFTEV